MNVGIVTTWFERGAAYVSKQYEEIISQKHKVYIFARGGEMFAKGDPKWDTPNVHWSQYPVNKHFINKHEFQKWLKENKIDVTLFNEQQDFEPILWCKEIGVKTVAYIDYYTEETIPLFNAYDALICNTKRHMSAFEDHPDANYIPWGTNVDLYKPKFSDYRLVEDGKIVFFNSAGMNPIRKGTDTFIKALDLCKSKHIKGIVHSQKNLMSCFPQLRQTIEKLVNEGILEVIEKTVPAPGLYYKADVYVYPSILDGIGLTVAEAISSGLVCIASNNPPMNEFVTEDNGALIPITRLFSRKDGYYWPQCRCDVNAFAQIMDYYAEHPDEVVAKKKNAREYAMEYLSFEKNAKLIIDVLEKVELRRVDPDLNKQIKTIESDRIKSIVNFMIKYKLYKLPIKMIRKVVSYRG